ncbi:hypothetical protein [Enterocloster bolteae]
MTTAIISDFQMGFRTVIGFEMTDRAAGYDPAARILACPRQQECRERRG